MPACAGMTVLFIVFLLTACGTDVAAYHTGCMQQFTKFADEVACVKNGLDSDPSMKQDTLVQEYVLAGEQLVKEVKAGKISEDEARLSFTHRLNDIKQRQADLLVQQARAAHADDWNRPHFASCHKAGNSVQCASY